MFLGRIEAELSSDVGDEEESSTEQSTLHEEVSDTSDVIVSIEYGFIEISYGDVVVDEHLNEKPNNFPVRLEEETGIVDVFRPDDELKFDEESPLLEELKRSVEKEGEADEMTTKCGKRAKIVRKSLVAPEYSEDMPTDSDSDFE